MDGLNGNKQGVKVLVVGSVLQLFFGIIYVWSVFVTPVSDFYSWDIASVKLMTSYMLCFFVLGTLIGGKLQLKIGASKVVLLGGLMLAGGMLCSAFIPRQYVWLLYLTYGIIGGFGVGAGYGANLSAAQQWFPQRRGFATGVSACAFGFSTVIFAPLIEWLIRQFGLQQSFIILAVVFCVAVLALFRFVSLPQNMANGSAASTVLLQKRQYTTSQMIRTKEFYFIIISLMLGTASFLILNPSFKTLAVERGLAPATGTVLVMMTGIANALGRLGAPFISDKIGREHTAMAIICITALSALSLCWVQGGLFIVAIALVAFCYGGFAGIYPVITSDCFGLSNVGSNYGAVLIGLAISSLFIPMIINLVPQMMLKFIILAVLAGIGAVLVFLLKLSKSRLY